MMNPWTLSALWVGLALIATLLAIWCRASSAHILVGAVAQPGIGVAPISVGQRPNEPQIAFLASSISTAHTFLAGTEPAPFIFPRRWRPALLVGLAGVFGPLLALRLESTSHYLSAILVPRRPSGFQCSGSNCGRESILPFPASFGREEVTESRVSGGPKHRWARWEALFLSDFREFSWPLKDHLMRSTL
jgi:hypothetical protein